MGWGYFMTSALLFFKLGFNFSQSFLVPSDFWYSIRMSHFPFFLMSRASRKTYSVPFLPSLVVNS